MKAPGVGFYVFLCLLLAAVVHAACYYPFLPNKVASHFGPGGQPDDWSTKEALIGVYAAALAGLAGVLLILGLLLSKLPASMINIPNKKHWLAPDRKAETCSIISGYFFWFANATIVLVMACMDITFRFNLERVQNLNGPIKVAIVSYVVFCVLWAAGIIWRFRKPIRADQNAE